MILEINKLSLKPLLLEEEISFGESFKYVKPLLDIKSNHIKVEAMRYEDFIRVIINVKATLSLESAYSLKPFDYELKVSDEYHFSSSKNDEEDDETILINGNKINLDEYVFELISASIPLSPKAKNEKLPSGGEGYNVYSEDEYNKLKEDETDPRFDKLKDIEI